jgi:hypothetical protein
VTDIITFLRNYDYDLCLARGDFWTLEEAVDYLAAYLANKESWQTRDEAYEGFLNSKEQLLATVRHGIDEGQLAVEVEYDSSHNGETDITDNGINFKKTTVIIASFIEWALDNSIEVPAAYAKYAANLNVKKARYYEKFGVKKSTIHHERCRAVAELLWSTDPDIPIAEMSRRSEIIEFGCEGEIYDMRTISRWLASLKAVRRPGRIKKAQPSCGQPNSFQSQSFEENHGSGI